MALPQNWQEIVQFLTQHGYSQNAAAGIAGNIMGESGGNPESVGSGGGGLIGFTPLPGGYVTGNRQRDLHFQLNKILAYNRKWHQFMPALNNAKTPEEAARIYMVDFERPANLSSLPLRQSTAGDVGRAMKGNFPTSGGSQPAQTTSSIMPSLNPVPYLLQSLGAGNLSDLLERGALILVGAVLLIMGIINMTGKGPSFSDVTKKVTPDYAEDTPEGRNAIKNAGDLDGGDESPGFKDRNRTDQGKPKPASSADKASESGPERARRVANPQLTEEQKNAEVPF